MAAAAWILLHALGGGLGAWLAIRYARSRALLDHPGERRSHAVPTPRGGGVAIAIALVAGTAWLAWRLPGQGTLLCGFGIGLALVSLVGWLDDHRPLAPALRLGVHVSSGALFAAGAWWQAGDPATTVVAFVAPVVLVNVWNFMDGIDGLAATQAILVASVASLLAGPTGLALGVALSAATLGFLPWNFPRARVFLGDVGSGGLGFALGGLVAFAVQAQGPRGLALILMPLSAFLLDAGLTLARRMLRGERWWQPHVTHAYQRAARAHGHVRVTCAYAVWTVTAAFCVWILRDLSFTYLIISLLPWYAVGAAAWWLLQRRWPLPALENRE